MKPMKTKSRPDIRALTRLVPSSGNLVQGQSELAINPALAEAASRVIAASQNHYGPAEGLIELRRAVAEKISAFNGIAIDPEGDPLQLLITPGATGALIAIAQTYLKVLQPWSLSLTILTTGTFSRSWGEPLRC